MFCAAPPTQPSQALDGIAAAHNFRDWNTASAKLPAESAYPSTDETAEQLTDRINQFAKSRSEAAKALSPEENRERLLAGRAFSDEERMEIETLLRQLGSASKSASV
ncbi:glyoxalase superfamily protein [Marinobacter sp.]|uniref:glyoxalase superfamily protein n=1 Tax=Marinobacter sp. TaxID=50741 RepID=UPI003A9390C5